jgi:hypothetical protein
MQARPAQRGSAEEPRAFDAAKQFHERAQGVKWSQRDTNRTRNYVFARNSQSCRQDGRTTNEREALAPVSLQRYRIVSGRSRRQAFWALFFVF